MKYAIQICEAYHKNPTPGITAEVIDAVRDKRISDGVLIVSSNEGELAKDGRKYTDAEAEVFEDGRIRLTISIRRVRHQYSDYAALDFLKKQGIRDLFKVVEGAANDFKIAQYKEGTLNRILSD